MPRTLVLTPKLVPLSQVHLGSLIIDTTYPYQDAFVLSSPTDGQDYFASPSSAFNALLSRTKNTDFHVQLTTIFSTTFGWNIDESRQLDAVEEKLYELKGPLTWFEDLCSSFKTKTWLQQRLGAGDNIFLIVGLRTLLDPKLAIKAEYGYNTSLDANVPGDAVISAVTGTPINTGGNLDFGGGGNFKRGGKQNVGFEQQGEHVYAVHYKKVKFSWFARDRVSQASLDKKNVWIDLTLSRATEDAVGSDQQVTGGTQESSEKQIIQADLADQLGVAGEHIFTEGSEEIFVLPDED